MTRQVIHYSTEELAWIKASATDVRRIAHARFCRKFNRVGVSLDHYKSLCKRKGWLTGRTGRYENGSVPQNKGKKMPFNQNSAMTQFKRGISPPNTKYLGHEMVTTDGYVMISVAETNPHTGYERRYVLKHRHLWVNANGPLADNMCLKCLDGNKTNTNLSNWEAIPRAILPRLNGIYGRGYDSAAPEIKTTIMAITKLEHKAKTSIAKPSESDG